MRCVQPAVGALVHGSRAATGARVQLLKTNYCLVLTAREASLPGFAQQVIEGGDDVWLRPLDVTDGNQRRALIGEVNAAWGGIDVLINNAGVSY